MSVVAAYVAAIAASAIAVLVLSLRRRPDDSSGAMLYEAAHSGFWQGASWLVLLVSLVIVLLPWIRAVLRAP
jgi:hypothetical protein